MIQSSEKIIKASFRGNPAKERQLFSSSSCLMPISVGQSIHEGKKFEAVIQLVNRSFQQCTILIDDSVQRHTLAIDKVIEPQMLYEEALTLGSQWVIRNKQVYSQLTIPYQVMRWDDWLKHVDYINQWEKIKKLYETDKQYKAAIHRNIDEFLTRFFARKEYPKDLNRSFQLCLDYLLEECAVMCLWTQGCYNFELYPSGRNKAMEATYERLIKTSFPHYLRPVAIRFKKYPEPRMECLASRDAFLETL